MTNTIAGGWTDERIYRQLDAVAFGIWHDDRWIDVVPHGEATSLAIEMFNDLNATIARLTQERDDLAKRVAHYEEPLPQMENGRYAVKCDHRFTGEGICIRCGEDAEEWDAGCVESIVNDLLDAQAERDSLRAQVEQEHDSLAKRVDDLESEVRARAEVAECLKVAYRELQTERDSLRAQLERTQESNHALSMAIHHCVNEYQLDGGGVYDTRSITLRRMPQLEGPDKWAVYNRNSVLNKEGYWEYEPLPSNRTDEYLQRCRFDSAKEALDFYNEQRRTVGEGEGQP